MLDAERWQEASDIGDAAGADEPSGPDQLAARPARAGGQAAGARRVVVGAVFWAGAVAHLGAEDGLVADRSPRGARDARAATTSSGTSPISSVAGEDEYAFKHILMRDVAYGQVPKGRRVDAPRPLLRLGDDPPEKRRRVRRDRRLAPRAGMPALPRGSTQPDRAAASRRLPERSRTPPAAPSGGKAFTRQSATTRGRSTCLATSIPACSSTSASGAQTS